MHARVTRLISPLPPPIRMYPDCASAAGTPNTYVTLKLSGVYVFPTSNPSAMTTFLFSVLLDCCWDYLVPVLCFTILILLACFWSLTDDINEPSYFDSIFVISNHRRVMEVSVKIILDFFAVQHAAMKQSYVLIE